MKRAAKLVGVFVLGWTLILAGLVLAIPGVPGPGVLIALVGLLVLASEFGWAKRLVDRFKRRFPRLGRMMDRARVKARQWFGKARPRRARATAPHSGMQTSPVSQKEMR